METEKMLVEMGYAIRKRVTGREEFLRTMNYVIPWAEWIDYVRPFVPAEAGGDRLASLLLRMYLLKKWFGMKASQVEDAIHDSYAMWLFVGMNALEEGLPNRELFEAFSKNLERSDADTMLTEAVDNFLRRYDRRIICGSVTEATIVQDWDAAQDTKVAQDTGDSVVVRVSPQNAAGESERMRRSEERVGRVSNDATWQEPQPRRSQDDETIRRLEQRLKQLESSKAVIDEDDDFDDEFDSDMHRGGSGIVGRVLLTVLILAILAGAAVTVYDYLQTGEWFRWFSQASGTVESSTEVPDTLLATPMNTLTAAQTAAPTAAPTAGSTVAPTPLEEGAFVQRVTPAKTAVVIPEMAQDQGVSAEPTPGVVALPTYESLLQVINNPGVTEGAASEIHSGMLDGVPYDADAEIRQNLERLEVGVPPATVITSEAAPDKKISITIDGMYEAETMRKIIALLIEHGVEATFYPAGLQAADTPEIVSEIAQAGFPVGNYTLREETGMEALDQRTLVENFTMTNKIIEVVSGNVPTRMKASATEYTEELLVAAGACGLNEVVQSTAYITFHSFKNYEEALSYVNRLSYGSIVSIKLSGQLEGSEYQPLEIIEEPAIDKEASVDAPENKVAGLGEAERLLLVIQWLLEAVNQADFSPQSVALREKNGGAVVDMVQSLNTTQPAVAYTFFGNYDHGNELQSVIAGLGEIGGKGTFFVTREDMTAYQQELSALVKAGHSLGIAIPSSAAQDFYVACSRLLQDKEQIASLFGYEARAVMLGSGTATDALREAVSAMDMALIGADLTFTREESQAAKTPQEMIDAVYKGNTEGFQRGKVLRFRLGYMESDQVLGELIKSLEGTRNAYEVVDAYQMATNKAYLYTYPLPDEQILPEVLNRIYPGQLTATGNDLIAFMSERYIGNPDICDKRRFPGFERLEIYQMDTVGKVPGVKGTAFLTFDDWGTDLPVTKLLDVLRKHNVKATFFVRTEFVVNNPNLLRAIAMDGHEIASHTHTHKALANPIGDTWIFEELSQEELSALRTDIQMSWDVLQHIVGDIRLDTGMPALSTMFRPPTLAVSRSGMEAVLDMGMTYIINGEYTSQDYKAESATALRRNLRLNIWDGTVAVLHFSDNAIHTADALDEYLTLNAAGENRKIYTYSRLSDYLKPKEEQGTKME